MFDLYTSIPNVERVRVRDALVYLMNEEQKSRVPTTYNEIYINLKHKQCLEITINCTHNVSSSIVFDFIDAFWVGTGTPIDFCCIGDRDNSSH